MLEQTLHTPALNNEGAPLPQTGPEHWRTEEKCYTPASSKAAALENCSRNEVLMNDGIRKNLRCVWGDAIHITGNQDVQYGKRIQVVPVGDTIEGVTCSLFDVYLKPYFMGA